MKSVKIILILLLGTISTVFAQDKEKAEILIKEGIVLHDKEQYNLALKKYQAALKADEKNVVALAECAITYMAKGDYNTAISYCKKAIKYHPDDPFLADVYVNYGTCYDFSKKKKKALKIYDEGIRKFPDYFLLYFNKGVTQVGVQDYDGSIKSFQMAVKHNPLHASSHYYMALLEADLGKKIPTILALTRFLTLEPTGKRSEKARKIYRKILAPEPEYDEEGKAVYNITLSEMMLGDDEYEFSTKDMLWALTAASGEETFQETADSLEIEKNFINSFKFKLSLFSGIVGDVEEEKKGFYSNYYVPFLKEMIKKEQDEVFTYLIYLYDEDESETALEWLEENEDKLNTFSKWVDNYKFD